MESKIQNEEPKRKYTEQEYWDNRYEVKKGSTFEWLENWEELKPIFKAEKIDGFYNPNDKQSGDETN